MKSTLDTLVGRALKISARTAGAYSAPSCSLTQKRELP